MQPDQNHGRKPNHCEHDREHQGDLTAYVVVAGYHRRCQHDDDKPEHTECELHIGSDRAQRVKPVPLAVGKVGERTRLAWLLWELLVAGALGTGVLLWSVHSRGLLRTRSRLPRVRSGLMRMRAGLRELRTRLPLRTPLVVAGILVRHYRPTRRVSATRIR